MPLRGEKRSAPTPGAATRDIGPPARAGPFCGRTRSWRTSAGTRRGAAGAMRGTSSRGFRLRSMNPLELGKGHGIVGDADFVDAIRGRYLSGDCGHAGDPGGENSGCACRSRSGSSRPSARRRARRARRSCKRVSGVSGAALLMELLYRHGGLKQREIGVLLGIDYSAVSVGRKRLRASMSESPQLRAVMTRAEGRLRQGKIRVAAVMPRRDGLPS